MPRLGTLWSIFQKKGETTFPTPEQSSDFQEYQTMPYNRYLWSITVRGIRKNDARQN